MKIGFIGLGAMGRPMSKNLLKAGHEVHVYDIVPAAVEEIVACGAVAEKCNKDVAANTDVVITMLPNSPHVKTAVTGPDGILAGKHEGMILLEMSSIAPLATKEIGKLCEEAGVPMLEAPVSGGVGGAAEGKLSIMCGGKPELFEQLKPILSVLGSSLRLCGDLGAGNTTKLVNQHIIAVEIATVAEAFAMGKKAGVEPEVVYKRICRFQGPGRQADCRYGPGVQSRFPPGPAYQGYGQRR